MSVGIDNLPASVRMSKILTADERALLATVSSVLAIEASFDDDHVKQIIQYYSLNPDEMEKELHCYAQKLLAQGKLYEAWQVLLVA